MMKKLTHIIAFLLISFFFFYHIGYAHEVSKQVPIRVSTDNGQSGALLYWHRNYDQTNKEYALILSGHSIGEAVSLSAFPRQGYDKKLMESINTPIADAGDDQTTVMPLNKVVLDASRTKDKNQPGYIFYHWEKISGPDTYKIQFPGKPITELQNMVVGTYALKLTIKINSGREVSDTMKVIVKPDPAKPGDVPFTANSQVKPYTALFQYGTNTGSYKDWSDTSVAGAAVKAGVHSIRLPLPEYFTRRYGYDVRLDAFEYYTHQLGMKELTLFVGQPSTEHRDRNTYPPANREAATFARLYEPIWDNGQNGTPINDNNYFAVYIYNLVKRYGNHVRFWEIVNEPDMTGFTDNGNRSRPENWWDTPPSPGSLLNLRAPIFHYIRMLRIAYEIIKKYDPEDYVTPGGIGNPTFLDALLRYTDNPDGGKKTSEYPLTGGAYFDLVSFHSYPAYGLRVWDNSIGWFRQLRYSDRAVDVMVDLKREFDSVLNNRGYNGNKYPKKPLILTEINLTRKTFQNSDGSDYYGTNEMQRNFIIKALVEAQKNDIKQLYTYGIGESEDYWIAHSAYQLMGLYENLNKATPETAILTDEGKAYKTTSMLLYGWYYDAARTQQLNLPKTIGGAAFKKGNEYRYVLWAKTHIDKSEAANATFSFPSSFNLANVYRYEWNYSVDPDAKKQISARNISLTGAPSFFSESKVIDSGNQEPVADAGKDQGVTLPANSITLNGTASNDQDGTIASYQWTKTSGPSDFTIHQENEATTEITGLVEGTYIFTLTVTDDKGATATDKVTISVTKTPVNQIPVAHTGKNQSITLPTSSVTLDGSASTDPDGNIVSYKWSHKSGPKGFKIKQPDEAKTTVSDLTEGTYIFTLTVKDNGGKTSSQEVTITVNKENNKVPSANAGKDQTITLPANSVTLDGTASSDPDGEITTWKWTQESGPAQATFSNANAAKTGVTGLKAGAYVFTLTVTDNKGISASDQVNVTVNTAGANQQPIADAGENRTITLPMNTATLDGSASTDPDGKIVAWQWAKRSGPDEAYIQNSGSEIATVSNLKEGTYVFTLTVTDDRGSRSSAKVTIITKSETETPSSDNQQPIADAGENRTIILPMNTATLDGSASKVPGGKIVAWQWAKRSGPDGAYIQNSGSEIATVSNLKEGTYVFTLTVTDDRGSSSSAKVTIITKPETETPSSDNQQPIADAGKNRSITLPVNTITLDGSASKDPDGKIVAWYWAKRSGHEGAYIQNSGSEIATVSNLKEGTYVFTLTVTDDKGSSSSAKVTIITKLWTGNTTENPSSDNQQPIADAGKNRSITLPVNTITLDGSASNDLEGKIVAWQWAKRSGPDGAYIQNSGSEIATVSNLKEGTYVFTLTVTDYKGSRSSAKVTIVANKAPLRMTNVSSIEDSNVAETSTNDFNQAAIDTMSKSALSVNSPYLKDTSRLTFKVYPNPVHSQLHVELSQPNSSFIRFRFIDINGRIIKTNDFGRQEKIFQQSIDVSNLTNGIYFMQLMEDNQLRGVQKIIKY